MIIPIALGVAIIATGPVIFFLGFKHGVHADMSTIHERLDALEAEVAKLKVGATADDLTALADRVGKLEADVGTEPAPVVAEVVEPAPVDPTLAQ